MGLIVGYGTSTGVRTIDSKPQVISATETVRVKVTLATRPMTVPSAKLDSVLYRRAAEVLDSYRKVHLKYMGTDSTVKATQLLHELNETVSLRQD